MKEENRSRGSTKQIFKINVDSPIHCPHDLSKRSEFRDDLPTLLNKKETAFNFTELLNLEQTSSVISIFDSDTDSISEVDEATSTKLKNLKFLGPYDRYKLVKPFVEAEETKDSVKSENSTEQEEGDRSIEERVAEVNLLFFLFIKNKN